MAFSSSPWLFLLFAVPGLWLTHRLYFRPGLPLRAGPRRLLALLTALAWLSLAWFALQPFWKFEPEIYHRPVVVLAVDESESYAALGARKAAEASLDSARRHYESLGFEARVIGFLDGARLPRVVDSLAIPNLQGILLWSDGRFREEAGRDWPAPVFPVTIPMHNEAQGEKIVVTDTEIEVAWRVTGPRPLDAVAELRAAGKTVWTQRLSAPAGTAPGARIVQALPLPAALAARLADAASDAGFAQAFQAFIRPANRAENATDKNDIVEVVFRGLKRTREVFMRPLASLEERGLVDALASDSTGVTAVFPSAWKAVPGDVAWLRAGRGPARVFPGTAATVEYHLPGDPVKSSRAFEGDARISWIEEGAAHLPREVLRLADIGFERVDLRAPDSGVEALAWAEQGGRRGLLLWRLWRPRNADAGARVFGFVPPPVWATAFQASGARDGGVRATQGRWARGVAAWARGPRAQADVPQRARLEGQRARDVEWSLIGADAETLARLAAASGGSVREKNNGEKIWPALRGGQTRETRFRAVSLAPAWPVVILVALSLCAAWALRKRFQID